MCLPRAVSEAPPVFAGVPTAAGRPSTTPSNPAKSRRGGTAQVMPAPAAPPRGVPRQPRAHAPPPPPPPRTVLYARSLKVGEGMRAASVAAALLACACAVALASGASGAAVPCQAYLTTPSARVGTGGATEGGAFAFVCEPAARAGGAARAPTRPPRRSAPPPSSAHPAPPPRLPTQSPPRRHAGQHRSQGVEGWGGAASLDARASCVCAGRVRQQQHSPRPPAHTPNPPPTPPPAHPQFSTTVEALMEANPGIAADGLLAAGQQLKLPPSGTH